MTRGEDFPVARRACDTLRTMLRLRLRLSVALAALLLTFGCANPCDELAEVCDACSDASYASECRAIVAKQNHSVCSADVAIFRAQCPSLPSTSGSGGAGGSP